MGSVYMVGESGVPLNKKTVQKIRPVSKCRVEVQRTRFKVVIKWFKQSRWDGNFNLYFFVLYYIGT